MGVKLVWLVEGMNWGVFHEILQSGKKLQHKQRRHFDWWIHRGNGQNGNANTTEEASQHTTGQGHQASKEEEAKACGFASGIAECVWDRVS